MGVKIVEVLADGLGELRVSVQDRGHDRDPVERMLGEEGLKCAVLTRGEALDRCHRDAVVPVAEQRVGLCRGLTDLDLPVAGPQLFDRGFVD